MSGEKCEHEWTTVSVPTTREVCSMCGVRRADAAVSGLKPVTTEVAKMGEVLPWGARAHEAREHTCPDCGTLRWAVSTDTYTLGGGCKSKTSWVALSRIRVPVKGEFPSREAALTALRAAPPPPGWEKLCTGDPEKCLDRKVAEFKAAEAALDAVLRDEAPIPSRLEVVERACLELERRHKELSWQVASLLAANAAAATRSGSDAPDDGFGKAAS